MSTKTTTRSSSIDQLIEQLAECLTLETAKRLVRLKADRKLQNRVEELAEKSTEGTLTAEERQEYASYVSFGSFIAILKSKARTLLKKTPSA